MTKRERHLLGRMTIKIKVSKVCPQEVLKGDKVNVLPVPYVTVHKVGWWLLLFQ